MSETQRPIEEVVDELHAVQRRAIKLQNELAGRTAIAWAVVAWPARVDGDIIVPISANYKSYAAPNGCDPEVVISTYTGHSTDDICGHESERLRYRASLCTCGVNSDIVSDHWSRLQTVLIRVFATKDEAVDAERHGDAHSNPKGRWGPLDAGRSSEDRW